MAEEHKIAVIARIHSDFSTKFGIPRQSGLVPQLQARIIFEPEFRIPEAVRGLEGFSHIWLVWVFHQVHQSKWSPTVRPPRLGGNQRVGVFASRSPFRPNPIGLSSVRLERIELTGPQGPVLHIRGADLVDGTPILDIKPYLPYGDCHPDATGGFASTPAEPTLQVEISPELLSRVPADRQDALRDLLALDPRPHYQQDSSRVYGFSFAGLEIQFTVSDGRLTVTGIQAP